jgi:hypothetical protein
MKSHYENLTFISTAIGCGYEPSIDAKADMALQTMRPTCSEQARSKTYHRTSFAGTHAAASVCEHASAARYLPMRPVVKSDSSNASAFDRYHYMNEVDEALRKLISNLALNYTSSDTTPVDDIINTTAIPSSNRNFSIPTDATATLSDGTPEPNIVGFDLIFLNTTSPSYVLLGHTNITNKKYYNSIAIWQAPTNDSSTSTTSELLRMSKNFESWAKISYYWAKVVFFVVGGLYALYQAVTMGKTMWSKFREWQDRR